ncbi:MAG: BON domain-containing protein, partial [Thermoleophilaceae bacterium]
AVEPVPPVPPPAPPQAPAPAPPADSGDRASEAELERSVRQALVEAAGDQGEAVEVEVAAGMVVLRGGVDSPEAIRDLERAATGVPGVEGVRVLLHLPGRRRR